MSPDEEQPRDEESNAVPQEQLIGVDVSHWQGKMDWQKTKAAGATFAFIKATEGDSYFDDRFLENATGAREAGILTGAYHYFNNDVDAIDQAEHFAQTIAKTQLDLPPVADIEERTGTISSEAIRAFVEAVEKKSGRRPIIYSSTGFWGGLPSTPWASDYDLWLAQYHDGDEPSLPTPWSDWIFWQYTSKGDGRAFGSSGANIDLNRFRGTIDQLKARYGLGSPIAKNLLRNPSFEGGTYIWKEVDDINCPNEFDLWHADESTYNPYSRQPKVQFSPPKVNVLKFDDMSGSDKKLVVGEAWPGDQILKFEGQGAMWVELSQTNSLEFGQYKLTIKQFASLADTVDEDDQIVWADDPFGRDGLLNIFANGRVLIENYALQPGKWDTVELEFEAEGETEIMVNYLCPFALEKNDIFADDWSLVRIGEAEEQPDYPAIINLLPLNATLKEMFDVLKTVHQNRETISTVAEDVVRLAVSGPVSLKVRVWAADRWDYDILSWLNDRGVEEVEKTTFPE